jgi:subtilisin family serine protease
MSHGSWKKRPVALIFLLFLLLEAPLSAANYLLEYSEPADLALLSSKYAFQIQRTLESHAVLVSTVTPWSAADLQLLRAEPGIREVENDAALRPSESEFGSRAAITLEALGDLLSGHSPQDYFGAQVRSGYVDQRGARAIHLKQAQDKFGTGAGVVAIIDTGVDANHAALRASLLPGYDFTRDRFDTVSEFSDLDQSTVVILDQSAKVDLNSKRIPIPLSQSTVVILDQSTVVILDGTKLPKAFGHGTMVAGLVHLVAPTARIMPLKAFRADGSANLSDIVRAIRYAADNGANVISMSFNLPVYSAELQAAVDYASSKGAVLIASAGNEGREIKVYPAALPNVIGTGSVNYSDLRSPFSNYGRSAKTSAPGEALITTFPGNNYAGVWGTSFSAGLVSGAISLMRSVRPNLSQGSARDCLDAGVKIDLEMGEARLDLPRALARCIRP